jgi:hypothetical protein
MLMNEAHRAGERKGCVAVKYVALWILDVGLKMTPWERVKRARALPALPSCAAKK